jgi:hypothetical protein
MLIEAICEQAGYSGDDGVEARNPKIRTLSSLPGDSPQSPVLLLLAHFLAPLLTLRLRPLLPRTKNMRSSPYSAVMMKMKQFPPMALMTL